MVACQFAVAIERVPTGLELMSNGSRRGDGEGPVFRESPDHDRDWPEVCRC